MLCNRHVERQEKEDQGWERTWDAVMGLEDDGQCRVVVLHAGRWAMHHASKHSKALTDLLLGLHIGGTSEQRQQREDDGGLHGVWRWSWARL